MCCDALSFFLLLSLGGVSFHVAQGGMAIAIHSSMRTCTQKLSLRAFLCARAHGGENGTRVDARL